MHSRLWRLIAIVANAVSITFVIRIHTGLTGQKSDPHFLPVLILAPIAIRLYAIIVFLPLNALLDRAGKTRLLHYELTAYGI